MLVGAFSAASREFLSINPCYLFFYDVKHLTLFSNLFFCLLHGTQKEIISQN